MAAAADLLPGGKSALLEAIMAESKRLVTCALAVKRQAPWLERHPRLNGMKVALQDYFTNGLIGVRATQAIDASQLLGAWQAF